MNSGTVFIFPFHDFKMELNDLLLEYMREEQDWIQ